VFFSESTSTDSLWLGTWSSVVFGWLGAIFGIAEMLGEDLVDALDLSTLFAGFHVAVLRRSNLRQLDDSHLLEARVCIKL
jgi:hypothetical protein